MDEGESGRRVIVMILLAEKRESEAHSVCALLPSHVVRCIEQRIVGAYRQVIQFYAGSTVGKIDGRLRQPRWSQIIAVFGAVVEVAGAEGVEQ